MNRWLDQVTEAFAWAAQALAGPAMPADVLAYIPTRWHELTPAEAEAVTEAARREVARGVRERERRALQAVGGAR